MADITMLKKEDISVDAPKVLSRFDVDAGAWFEAREDGLCFIEQKLDKDGNKHETPHRLTKSVIEIKGFLRPLDGDGERGLLVRVDDREITVRREAVSKTFDLEAWLADRGVRFDPAQTSKIRRYFMLWDGPPVTAYTWNGWQRNGAFVAGDLVLRGEGRVLQTEANITRYGQRGSFEDWQRNVLAQSYKKPGWVFGILVGLSSPLLQRLDIGSGYAFNLHGKSSTGKTVALQAAASVWGRPDRQGCLKSFRTTVNALEGLCEGANHIGLTLDEMKLADERIIREFAYLFANGMGKERMKSNAEMQRRRVWLTNAFISSEKTAEGIFDAAGKAQAAGQVVRFIDIDGAPLLPQLPWQEVSAFEDALACNYGTAGPEFVRRIMDMGDLKERHVRAVHSIYSGEDGRLRRAAAGFAMLALAGEIMEIETAVVKEAFDRWIGEGVANALDDGHQTAKRILDFIDREMRASIIEIAEERDDEGEDAFDDLNTSGEVGNSYRARAGWYEGDDVYLLPSTVDKLREGISKTAFYEWLRERQIISTRPGQSGHTVYVPRLKPRRTAVKFDVARLREAVEV